MPGAGPAPAQQPPGEPAHVRANTEVREEWALEGANIPPLAPLERGSACGSLTLWLYSHTKKKQKKPPQKKDVVKHKRLKSKPLTASPEHIRLNSDAKLLFAKLHESIIRSHSLSVLWIYCSGALSHFYSTKHSRYKPPPFFKDFDTSLYVHNAAARHTKSSVQVWFFFFLKRLKWVLQFLIYRHIKTVRVTL